MFRLAIADLLSGVPGFFVIDNVPNGRELISCLESSKVPPDVCLLDISMPEMDGYATLKILQERWPHIKVLVLSMHTEQYPVLRMLAEGACGFLAKNMKPAELVKAIRTVYAKGSYFAGIPAKYMDSKLRLTKAMVPSISDNELEFLALACTDMTYAQIAVQLDRSARTIENYRDNLFKKLKVKSRTDMVLFALRSGLVPLEQKQTAPHH